MAEDLLPGGGTTSARLAPGKVSIGEDMFLNPERRCPVVILQDTSASMLPNIEQVNQGLRSLRADLLTDPLASQRVEIAIVTFGRRAGRRAVKVSAGAAAARQTGAVGRARGWAGTRRGGGSRPSSSRHASRSSSLA